MGVNIKNFKAWRKRAKFTQKSLEDEAGVGRGIVSRLESAKSGVTVETLQKLAKAMNVPVAVFLEEE
jgi:transcriptional regulator with XRE-family HTH domain